MNKIRPKKTKFVVKWTMNDVVIKLTLSILLFIYLKQIEIHVYLFYDLKDVKSYGTNIK